MPDIIFISGWMDKFYLKCASLLKKKGAKIVCCMDTQWQNKLRQKIAVLTRHLNFVIHFDAFWIAGERSAQFAKKLQVNGQEIWHGVYTCNTKQFKNAYNNRMQFSSEQNNSSWPRKFLFVGQYRARKGIDCLLKGYKSYRNKTRDPWELHCVGDGPLKTQIENSDGIVDHGFIQPDKLTELFKQTGTLVLPSIYEPWGVVLHEATAAGLPIICSDACGASVELVRDGYNGYLFRAGNASELEAAFYNVSTANHTDIQKMSKRSFLISQQFSPELWVEYLIRKATQLIRK
jgi:glycosyltransferase involved in cell wall biosynthesis